MFIKIFPLDEYFLTNVQKIDEITNSRKQKLLNMLRWPPSLQAAVCTWPCINIIRELNNTDKQTRNCAACLRLGVEVRMIMYGQPYNSTTLEGCSPDPNAINEKVIIKMPLDYTFIYVICCFMFLFVCLRTFLCVDCALNVWNFRIK